MNPRDMDAVAFGLGDPNLSAVAEEDFVKNTMLECLSSKRVLKIYLVTQHCAYM